MIGNTVLVIVNLFAFTGDGITVEHVDSMEACKSEIKEIAFNAFDRGDEVTKTRDNTRVEVNLQWKYSCETIKPLYKG